MHERPANRLRQELDEDTKSKFDDRRSTFHCFQQFCFPSELNNLNPDNFEIPYAYSHHQAAFYWTREAALAALTWNVSARPPCLNCVLEGEKVAQRCDRMGRQWISKGWVTSCSCCAEAGRQRACVEMIELRIVPNFRGVLANGKAMTYRFDERGVDRFIWTEGERELRGAGKVIWRPINLQHGDAETKARLMARFEAGGADALTDLCISRELFQREKHDSHARAWLRAQFMMSRTVDKWDRAENPLHVSEKMTGPGVAYRLEGGRHIKETQKSVLFFEELRQFEQVWQGELLLARRKDRDEEMKNLSRAAADRIDARWQTELGMVLMSIKNFFEKKEAVLASQLRKRSHDLNPLVATKLDKEDAELAYWEAASVLTSEARRWMEDLIPEMLFPSKT